MVPMTIRKMLKTDIEAVHRIETLSFRTPWSLESFEQEVEENHLAYYAVVELEGVVVGYGGLWQVFDEVHVTNVAIDPEYRGLRFKSTIDVTFDGPFKTTRCPAYDIGSPRFQHCGHRALSEPRF
jgi:hypothetical protein